MFNALRGWLSHREHQDWQYAGADNASGTEGHYYWHIEECRWCDRKRTVMNGNCACGGNSNA